MRSFALIALLPLALALSRRQEATPPACAVGCLADISLNPAPCAGDDFKCLCTDASIQTKITQCLTESCGSTEQLTTAATYLQGVCGAAGATVPVPSGLGGSASASSAVASASASASASAGVSASVSSVASGISASASGVSASVTSVLSTASSVSASKSSSIAASASSSSGAQPTGMARGFAAVGLGAAVGVLGMM